MLRQWKHYQFFLDKLLDEVLAIVISVTAVLLFGEIIPQALCSRYGLAIGAYLSPLVKLLMLLVFVISYPISKILDWVFGKQQSALFKRTQLRELMSLHYHGGQLTQDEVTVIQGALDMQEKTVVTAMTPLKDVFMLNYSDYYDRDLVNILIQHRHSRIPVYKGNIHNIVGVVHTKLLIQFNPDEKTPISMLPIQMPSFKVSSEMSLYDLLNVMQTGRCHLAIVIDSNLSENNVLGIITLEDVLETLIQEEILDEKDAGSASYRENMYAHISVEKIITNEHHELSRSPPKVRLSVKLLPLKSLSTENLAIYAPALDGKK